jgi:hypothetical protein
MANFQKIQIKRGSQENLDALLGSSLAIGEILFTTDTKQVYVVDEDKNKNLIGKVKSGADSAKGTAKTPGQLYFATDTKILWLDQGSVTGWVQASATSIDDLADGTYAKVLATQVSSGMVTRIDDGTHSVTAEAAADHIADETIHRVIDDASVSSTKLWSSDKTKNYVDNSITGLTWKPPVDKIVAALPSAAALADGYRVVLSTDNKIYTVASGAWNSGVMPEANWAVLDKEFDAGYTFDAEGAGWVQFSGAGQIDAGSGLSKSGNTISINMGAGIKVLPADEVGLDLESTGGLELSSDLTDGQLRIKSDVTTANVAPIALSANGAGVAVDGTMIEVSSGKIQIKASGVDTLQVKSSAITTPKIADYNVTDAKLAADSVITSKILNSNVTTAKIADENVTDAKLATDAVLTGKIKDDAVTAAKINSDVAGLGLGQDSDGSLKVNVDAVSIKLDGDDLYVAIVDGGVF